MITVKLVGISLHLEAPELEGSPTDPLEKFRE
jgi:hypothetical protein